MCPVRKEGGKKTSFLSLGSREAAGRNREVKEQKQKNTELLKKPQLVNGVQCSREGKDHKS